MKRSALIFASMLLILSAFTGCSSQGAVMEEGKVNVVTSFFPLYDFAKAIGGEHVNVINMIPAGVEPHDWTPKSQDMTNLSKAQLFVYQGAGFEGWTDHVLSGIDMEGIVVVEASAGVDLLEASNTSGAHSDVQSARGEEEHADDHGHEKADAHAHENEKVDDHAHEEEEHAEDDGHDHGAYDPHTWLSPKSALKMAENIANGLKQADPDHAADYEKNYEAFAAELKGLDSEYSEKLSKLTNREMIVSHQAFGYVARDYKLIQMPMMGIAAEAEPTAQDLKKISEFVKEHNVKYIFTEELVSDALAKTLANDLGIQTLPLHPLEGLTEAELSAGETYISIMKRNLEYLVTALQ